MAVKTIIYKTYGECRNSFLSSALDFEETLDHEREHFDKAVALGYNPVYGFRVILDFPPVILAGLVDFEGRVPEGQDLIDICLAPKNPGEHDHSLAEKTRSELTQQKNNPMPRS